MFEKPAIVLWLLMTNALALLLWGWARRKLPESLAKHSFLRFLLAYLCWSNPLLLVQLVPPEGESIRFISQMIHVGGILFVASLGHFVLTLSCPEETRSWRFRLFMLNYAFVAGITFAGYLENGVQIGEHGLAPIPGPFLPYFNFTMIAFGLYFLVGALLAYRRERVELMTLQLRALLWTSIPSFSLLMITNAVVPGLTGNYEATPAGPLWFLILFAGIAFILYQGEALLIIPAVRSLLRIPSMHKDVNLQQAASLAQALVASSKNHSSSVRRLSFDDRAGNSRHIYLSSNVSSIVEQSSQENSGEVGVISSVVNGMLSLVRFRRWRERASRLELPEEKDKE